MSRTEPHQPSSSGRIGKAAPDPASALQGLRLVIDPGHGGMDSGSVDGEADWTLAVATELTRRCLAMGAKVLATRREDVFVPRIVRSAVVREWGATVVISLHLGAPQAQSAAAVRFGASWWRRRRAAGLAGHLLEALDRTIPIRLLPWIGTHQMQCVSPPTPVRAVQLLVIVHPPANGGPFSASPEGWAEALSRGVASYCGVTVPTTSGTAPPPREAGLARGGPEVHPYPASVRASPPVQRQTVPLIPGQRQRFTLPPWGRGGAIGSAKR